MSCLEKGRQALALPQEPSWASPPVTGASGNQGPIPYAKHKEAVPAESEGCGSTPTPDPRSGYPSNSCGPSQANAEHALRNTGMLVQVSFHTCLCSGSFRGVFQPQVYPSYREGGSLPLKETSVPEQCLEFQLHPSLAV